MTLNSGMGKEAMMVETESILVVMMMMEDDVE